MLGPICLKCLEQDMSFSLYHHFLRKQRRLMAQDFKNQDVISTAKRVYAYFNSFLCSTFKLFNWGQVDGVYNQTVKFIQKHFRPFFFKKQRKSVCLEFHVFEIVLFLIEFYFSKEFWDQTFVFTLLTFFTQKFFVFFSSAVVLGGVITILTGSFFPPLSPRSVTQRPSALPVL